MFENDSAAAPIPVVSFTLGNCSRETPRAPLLIMVLHQYYLWLVLPHPSVTGVTTGGQKHFDLFKASCRPKGSKSRRAAGSSLLDLWSRAFR